ncbi:MAG: hypothetical protein GY742_21650 [Hyphomicrobiales bacterium]|nr:hypothetical protein [Hyphomicrobiales bacterium]
MADMIAACMSDKRDQASITLHAKHTTLQMNRVQMAWYTVVKTIKKQQYLYRQRTFRVGGKVRTESKYIGVVSSGASDGVVSVTSYDEIEAQAISIKDNATTSHPDAVMIGDEVRTLVSAQMVIHPQRNSKAATRQSG